MSPWWRAQYKNAKDKLVPLKGVETAECPVSLISGEMMGFLALYGRLATVKEASGGVAGLGSDLGAWPARLVDALMVCQVESNRAENVRMSGH